MAYLVEKVAEYSMYANSMQSACGRREDGERRAASVTGMGEASEGGWIEVGVSVFQGKGSVSLQGHWRAFRSF